MPFAVVLSPVVHKKPFLLVQLEEAGTVLKNTLCTPPPRKKNKTVKAFHQINISQNSVEFYFEG